MDFTPWPALLADTDGFAGPIAESAPRTTTTDLIVGVATDWITHPIMLTHRGGSVPTPENDIRRSDAMNACPELPGEPMEVLTASPLPQLRRLVVTATDDEVIITGRVSSYYMKQLAQEALRPTLGDRRLLNHVEVITAN